MASPWSGLSFSASSRRSSDGLSGLSSRWCALRPHWPRQSLVHLSGFQIGHTHEQAGRPFFRVLPEPLEGRDRTRGEAARPVPRSEPCIASCRLRAPRRPTIFFRPGKTGQASPGLLQPVLRVLCLFRGPRPGLRSAGPDQRRPRHRPGAKCRILAARSRSRSRPSTSLPPAFARAREATSARMRACRVRPADGPPPQSGWCGRGPPPGAPTRKREPPSPRSSPTATRGGSAPRSFGPRHGSIPRVACPAGSPPSSANGAGA